MTRREAGEGGSSSRSRTVAVRVFVVLFAVAALVPGFGLADLTTPINPRWHGGYVAEVGYGALAGILIPVGFLAQTWFPERRIAGLQQVAAAVPAYIGAGALGGDDDFFPFAAIVAAATAIVVALHPARRRFLARGRLRPRLAILALAMAVPAVLYGLEATANQRDGVPPLALDSHGPLNSWAALGAAAFAVALVGLLTSLGTEGFPVPGWSAAAAVAVWGVTSLAHPGDPGAERRGWAAFAIAWAVVFVVAVERERRKGRRESNCRTILERSGGD